MFFGVPDHPRDTKAHKRYVLRFGELRIGVIAIKSGVDIQLYARMNSISETEIEIHIAVGIGLAGIFMHGIGIKRTERLDIHTNFVG